MDVRVGVASPPSLTLADDGASRQAGGPARDLVFRQGDCGRPSRSFARPVWGSSGAGLGRASCPTDGRGVRTLGWCPEAHNEGPW
jgi:hypothetical protein